MPSLSYSLSHPSPVSINLPLRIYNTNILVPVISGKGIRKKSKDKNTKDWNVFHFTVLTLDFFSVNYTSVCYNNEYMTLYILYAKWEIYI